MVQRSGAVCAAIAVKSGQTSPDEYSAILPLLFFCLGNVAGEQEQELATTSFQNGRVRAGNAETDC